MTRLRDGLSSLVRRNALRPAVWQSPSVLRRVMIAVLLTAVFGPALYTTLGCGGVSSGPTAPVPNPANATISGVVTSATTGAAVAGAVVAARLPSGAAEYNTVTDAAGHYTTSSVSGPVDLVVTAARYQTYVQRVEVQPGSNTRNVQLQPAG